MQCMNLRAKINFILAAFDFMPLKQIILLPEKKGIVLNSEYIFSKGQIESFKIQKTIHFSTGAQNLTCFKV